jgi:DNA ligase-1
MENLFRKTTNKSGTYMIFDMLTIDEFFNGESKDDYYTRKLAISNLKENINENEFKYLKFIEPIAMFQNPTIDQLDEITRQAVDQGFEGIVIKDFTSKYKANRNYGWQKMKPFITEEFKIIGYTQGEGKYQNSLGNILLDVDGITCGCGSGKYLTDQKRDEIWNNKEKYLGKFAEIKYQNRIKKTGLLRFPVFQSLREDI